MNYSELLMADQKLNKKNITRRFLAIANNYNNRLIKIRGNHMNMKSSKRLHPPPPLHIEDI